MLLYLYTKSGIRRLDPPVRRQACLLKHGGSVQTRLDQSHLTTRLRGSVWGPESGVGGWGPDSDQPRIPVSWTR
jgi:hypothetical protein